VLSKLFKKEKPRVYLDKLIVVPRSELRKIDEWGLFENEDLEEGLRNRLNDLFCLPHISSREEVRKNDLGLEVALVELQGGEFDAVSIGGIGGFPIFWRPKVKIVSRLYNIDTGKTVTTFRTTEKMSWGKYVSKIFTINGFFRYKALFGVKDVEPLLFVACEKLLIYRAKAV